MFGFHFERRFLRFWREETERVLFLRKGKNFFKKAVKRERDML